MNNFKIISIIGHDTGVFSKPLVNTVIVILEKCENDEIQRNDNIVNFCRIKNEHQRAADFAICLRGNVETLGSERFRHARQVDQPGLECHFQ